MELSEVSVSEYVILFGLGAKEYFLMLIHLLHLWIRGLASHGAIHTRNAPLQFSISGFFPLWAQSPSPALPEQLLGRLKAKGKSLVLSVASKGFTKAKHSPSCAFLTLDFLQCPSSRRADTRECDSGKVAGFALLC